MLTGFLSLLPFGANFRLYSLKSSEKSLWRFKNRFKRLANQSPFQRTERNLSAVFEIAIDKVLGKDQGISRITKGIDFQFSSLAIFTVELSARFGKEENLDTFGILKEACFFMKKSYIPNASLYVLKIDSNNNPNELFVSGLRLSY